MSVRWSRDDAAFVARLIHPLSPSQLRPPPPLILQKPKTTPICKLEYFCRNASQLRATGRVLCARDSVPTWQPAQHLMQWHWSQSSKYRAGRSYSSSRGAQLGTKKNGNGGQGVQVIGEPGIHCGKEWTIINRLNSWNLLDLVGLKPKGKRGG